MSFKSSILMKSAGGGALLLAALAVTACSDAPGGAAASKGPAAKVSAAEPASEGSAPRLRLMSQTQYVNTIKSVFGDDLRLKVRFAPVRRKEGMLALGAASAGVTPASVEQFQLMAAGVAAQVLEPARRAYIVGCNPADAKAADDACATHFFKTVGRLLYRRPLSDTEVSHLAGEAGKVANQSKDFYNGLTLTFASMLYDPDFLYIHDKSEPDPARPGKYRLTAYSLATRLSLLLWNSAPDDELLKAAEKGELYTKGGREKVIDRMIASTRFEGGVRAFFDDMLAFDDFDTLAKDPTIYPAFTGTAAEDVREQTLLTIVDHLVTRNADYRDLFTTRRTFLTPELATVYGVPSVGRGWNAYEFPAGGPRGGILTQAAFLSVHSHPGRSSPTKRGRALREELLCQRVPDPPPNVDFSAVEDPKSPLKTARERLDFHRTNPACAGCHRITDPIGLALETFDGSGRYRDNEKGAKIDASGSLDGKSFPDAAGLGQALHDNPALTQCLAKRVYGYGVGGPPTAQDQDLVNYFDQRFAAQGYTLPSLMKAVAMSAAFTRIALPAPVTTKADAGGPAPAATK